MIPYLIVFTASLLFAFLIQSKKVTESTKRVALAILTCLLSLFGGLRATSVGTDVEVYGISWFEQAQNASSFNSYINRKLNASDEEAKDYGYMGLNYIVAKTSGNFTTFLIVLQLVTNLPILLVLYKRRDEAPFALGILIYLCLFYCRNLNMLRQGAALSVVFLASEYLRQSKKAKFAILAAIAYSLHSTALLMIVVQILLYLSKKITITRIKTIFKYIFVGSIILVTFLSAAMPILYKLGVISTRIFNYTNTFKNVDGGLPLTDLIMFTAITIPAIMAFGNKKTAKNQATEDALTIEGLILYFTRLTMTYSDRLALYFQYFGLLSAPRNIKNISEKKHRSICYFTICVLLITYWYVKHVVMGAHEVVPYRSVL